MSHLALIDPLNAGDPDPQAIFQTVSLETVLQTGLEGLVNSREITIRGARY